MNEIHSDDSDQNDSLYQNDAEILYDTQTPQIPQTPQTPTTMGNNDKTDSEHLDDKGDTISTITSKGDGMDEYVEWSKGKVWPNVI